MDSIPFYYQTEYPEGRDGYVYPHRVSEARPLADDNGIWRIHAYFLNEVLTMRRYLGSVQGYPSYSDAMAAIPYVLMGLDPFGGAPFSQNVPGFIRTWTVSGNPYAYRPVGIFSEAAAFEDTQRDYWYVRGRLSGSTTSRLSPPYSTEAEAITASAYVLTGLAVPTASA